MKDSDSLKYTIKTVAHMAGVSVSTVSRVMNNPESVTEHKRQKVLDVIAEVNYKPSPVARALSYERIGSVGIIVPNIVNQTSASLVYGAGDYLEQNGFSFILYDAREDLDREIRFYKSIPQKLIEGAIVIYGNGSDETYAELSRNIPLTLLGLPMMNLEISQITVNDQLGILNLIQHFYDLGHRQLGFFGGSLATSSGGRRCMLFKSIMDEFGLKYSDSHIVNNPWTMEGGYQSALKLADLKNDLPSAFLCASDQIAIGAMRGFTERGLRVPDDISVSGFDNSPMSHFITPSLTTLNYPHTDLGRMAAENLIEKIRNPESSIMRKILPLDVIPGESSRKIA